MGLPTGQVNTWSHTVSGRDFPRSRVNKQKDAVSFRVRLFNPSSHTHTQTHVVLQTTGAHVWHRLWELEKLLHSFYDQKRPVKRVRSWPCLLYKQPRRRSPEASWSPVWSEEKETNRQPNKKGKFMPPKGNWKTCSVKSFRIYEYQVVFSLKHINKEKTSSQSL